MEYGTLLSLVVAMSIMAAAMFIGMSIMRIYIDSRKPDVVDLINSALNEDIGSDDEKKNETLEVYWTNLFAKTGRRFVSPHTALQIVMVVAVMGLALGAGFTPGDAIIRAVGGISVAVGAVFLLHAGLKMETGRRNNILSKQLPIFITSMRTQLQGNTTISQAIIRSVDDLPEPLYSELLIVKRDLVSGASITAALNHLSRKTDIKELEFLIAAINIAASSGSDLEPQLKKIEEILDNRRKINNAIATAVASINPTRFVAAAVIPGTFLWSYLSDADNRDFWNSFMGVAFLFVTVLLYIIGLIVFNRFIASLKKGV